MTPEPDGGWLTKYLTKYLGPKPKPMTDEERKAEVEVLETIMERYKTRPEPEPVVYRCPLCSVEIGQKQSDWVNHLAQKHTSLELAHYIAEEEWRHDD